jgi:hypothetical protein
LFREHLLYAALCIALSSLSLAQQPGARSPNGGLLQATLIKPGNPPFHLKAEISDRDGYYSGDIEIYWVSPTLWRRTINTHAFSQTSVVNGTQVLEQDSDDYFPSTLNTLLAAMTDPQHLIDALGAGERILSRANGGTKPPPICGHIDPNSSPGMQRICYTGPYKDMESINSVPHGVSFADYKNFQGIKVARSLTAKTVAARVTELEELKEPDSSLFAIDVPTPLEKQLHVLTLSESDLRALAMQPLEIIWPQVLDGATTGTSSYYVSIDHTGKIRETTIVKDTNERANESALRQIQKWKFKPLIKDGVPVQVEGVLNFITDTRAWGPAEPLSDADVRKLASNIGDPVFPPGTAPGCFCTARVSIDEEGNLIEAIASEDETPGLFTPCYQAIKMWVFHPIMENGQPRPYRGEITFRVP